MSEKRVCRICGKTIDISNPSEEKWIIPYPREYIHTKCYKDWGNNRNNIETNDRSDSFWHFSLYHYLIRELKLPNIDYVKLGSQWNNLLKKGYTAKGIYFTVRYVYIVRRNDPKKALGGIGLVNEDNYKAAGEYWQALHDKKERVQKNLQEQSAESKVIHIKRKQATKEKYNLDDIGGEE